MIESERHLINLGINPQGIKQYLTLRERKKSFVVYLILEDAQRKRVYRKVTDIRKSTLAELASGNHVSSDGDSIDILSQKLRSDLNELLSRVTESKKHNIVK